MAKTIEYYYSLISPWTYLGGERLEAIARKHGADIRYKPMMLATVFPATGGLPLAKRAPVRQAYRLMELPRWRDYLKIPLNLHPEFFPADERRAALMVIAAAARDLDAGTLSNAILRAVWAEDRDIADTATLSAIADGCGLDGQALLADSEGDAAVETYEANTQDALERGVFGAPTYVYGDELFWGQDRLDFLDRALTG